MKVTTGTRVKRVVVERRPEQLRLPRAPRVGPHVDRCDRMTGGIEAEESMPECRDTDSASFLGGPVRVDRVQARDDAFEQLRRVVLDTTVRCDGRRVLDLVRAP